MYTTSYRTDGRIIRYKNNRDGRSIFDKSVTNPLSSRYEFYCDFCKNFTFGQSNRVLCNIIIVLFTSVVVVVIVLVFSLQSSMYYLYNVIYDYSII